MKKALLYVRVSSKEQEAGFSLDAQEKFGYDYARRIEAEVVRVYKVSESAWKKDRVAFNQLVDYAKKHPEIQHVIFDVTDRMTRNDFDKLKILTLTKEYGKTIHFSRSNKILDKNATPEDVFMLDIEVAVAKKQSNDISRKTKMGMQEKAEQGIYPSIAALGYTNNRITHLIDVDKERAPLFKRMFELMVTGNYSHGMLTEIMRREGLRNRKGNPCQDSAIAHFLRNPIYCGLFRWKGKIHQGSHPPIISKQLFDSVQAVMSGKARPASRGMKNFPFNSLLVCGHCGCKVLGELKKNRYHYYHCSFSKGRHAGKSYFREEKLAQLLEEPIKRISIDQPTAEWLKEALMEDSKPAIELREKRMNALKTQLGVTNNRISRLYDAKFDGTLTEEAFVAKEREYQSQLIEMKAQIAGMETTNPTFEVDASRTLELCNRLYSLYVAGNYEEKVKLLKLVASNYTLNDVSIEPIYRKPFGFIAEGLSCHNWLPEPYSATTVF